MKQMVVGLAVSVFCLFFSGQVMAEEITIVGTGSGAAVLEAVGAAFTANNPGVTIVVPKSIGSGGGIKAVGSDKDVVGRVARGIKDKEESYGLTYLAYAKNPIVFFVNKSVGIKDLTTQQLCDIYSGKITNWKDVGGKDATIKVIRREDGDSSLEVLVELFPGFKDITLTAKSKTTLSDPETCQLTERKADTIAFGTYANARNYGVDILSIEGKVATDSDYPYVGTLALIFKEKNNTGNIKKFIEFATSPAAHPAITEAGASAL
ncbi:MAG: substrate-binding domain-containing protein [Proteobacteria bacterium]|nr:substrate-binding domain-containing protein [Pseudomonadota bacterium]MBU1060782.1 substrate-binding domain-containing protein [Pseudomonadota bacterium]